MRPVVVFAAAAALGAACSPSVRALSSYGVHFDEYGLNEVAALAEGASGTVTFSVYERCVIGTCAPTRLNGVTIAAWCENDGCIAEPILPTDNRSRGSVRVTALRAGSTGLHVDFRGDEGVEVSGVVDVTFPEVERVSCWIDEHVSGRPLLIGKTWECQMRAHGTMDRQLQTNVHAVRVAIEGDAVVEEMARGTQPSGLAFRTVQQGTSDIHLSLGGRKLVVSTQVVSPDDVLSLEVCHRGAGFGPALTELYLHEYHETEHYYVVARLADGQRTLVPDALVSVDPPELASIAFGQGGLEIDGMRRGDGTLHIRHASLDETMAIRVADH